MAENGQGFSRAGILAAADQEGAGANRIAASTGSPQAAKKPEHVILPKFNTYSGSQGTQELQTDIQRARELENWKRVDTLANHLKRKDTGFTVVADFLQGEALLESHLRTKMDPNFNPSKVIKGNIEVARKSLENACHQNGYKYGIYVDAHVLLAKYNYWMANFEKSLECYSLARMDLVEEKPLPTRSLKMMAEAFAIRASCMEKNVQELDSYSPDAIIKFYETSSDLTLLYLQVADRIVINRNRQVHSEPEPSVLGQTTPDIDDTDEELPFSPWLGPILEGAAFKAVILYIANDQPTKAITRLRQMLMAEETQSTREIRRYAACMLADILLSNCSNFRYIRPDLDVVVTRKNLKFEENPWKPIKHDSPTSFTPHNRYEEVFLALMIAEVVGNQNAVLNQSSGAVNQVQTTCNATAMTCDLLTLACARFDDFGLVREMLERSMVFSYSTPHNWVQFSYTLSILHRYCRSILVARGLYEMQPVYVPFHLCMATARTCLIKTFNYPEAIKWVKRALQTEEGRSNRFLRGKGELCHGVAHLMSSYNQDNLVMRKLCRKTALEHFKKSEEEDGRDHLVHFFLAFSYAQLREYPLANRHVRRALSLDRTHLQSLHLAVLLLTVNRDNDQAIRLCEETIEEHPYSLELRFLRLTLIEYERGPEDALEAARQLLQDWQKMIAAEMLEQEEALIDRNKTMGFMVAAPSDASIKEGNTISVVDSGGGAESRIQSSFLNGTEDNQTADEDEDLGTVISNEVEGNPFKNRRLDSSSSLGCIWVMIAKFYLGMGDWESAIKCQAEAKNLDISTSELLLLTGLIFEVKGDLDKAKNELQSLITLRPMSSRALYHLARVLFKMGRYSWSHNLIQIGIRQVPYSEEMWFLKGQVMEKLAFEVTMGQDPLQELEYFFSDGLREGKTTKKKAKRSSKANTEELTSDYLSVQTTAQPSDKGYLQLVSDEELDRGSRAIAPGKVMEVRKSGQSQLGADGLFCIPRTWFEEHDRTGNMSDFRQHESSKIYKKGAEAYSVALSLHCKNPLLPFESIQISL